MSREIGLVELIENILEKHQPHPEGYCNCGFCVCGFLHQAAMLAPEIERLLAEERKPMECGHPKACLSPITVEYRDGTLEDAQECSFCVQLKVEREKVRELCLKAAWGTRGADAIRQLDLTKDLAPSMEEKQNDRHDG